MQTILNNTQFAVRQNQKDGIFLTAAALSYDVLEPAGQQSLLNTTEPKLNWYVKLCRIDRRYRGYTPFHLTFAKSDGAPVMSIKRGWAYGSMYRPAIEIRDAGGTLIGTLKQAFSPIHARFDALDAHGKPLFSVKGDWADWDFKFLQGERQIAFLTKGSGERLLTELASTRDNYSLQINDDVPAPMRQLILAIAVAVDISRNE